MAVHLSSLRVAPELDASKYTAGAQQKVAADRAMAASSAAAGQAVAATDTKISQAGDVLARLSRQYVEGYSAQQRFSQGLGQLQRGLESGKISIEGAERILVGMNQKLGLMGDASDLASKGQMQLSAAVKAANLQIEGQVIAAEKANAAARRMAAANTNTRGSGASQFAALNATNQFQDIAITSMMGQSIPTIALQQGTQLGMSLQASLGEQGAAGAAKVLGSAIFGLFSPINLISIGITAAAAAAIQWFSKSKDGAKSLDETLKAHSGTLQLLKAQYGELGEVVERVVTIGGPGLAMADSRATLAILQAQIREQMAPLSDDVRGGGFLRNGLFGSRESNLTDLTELASNSPFKKVVDDFLSAVKSGKGDLADFDARLESVFDTLRQGSDAPAALHEEMQRLNDAAVDLFSVPEKYAPFAGAINELSMEGASGLSAFIAEVDKLGQTPGLRKAADDLINLGKEAAGSAEKVKELEAALNRIGARQRGPLIGSPDEDARFRYLDDQRVALDDARRQFEADMLGLGARSPQERAAAARAREEVRDVKGESPEVRNQRIELAGKRALLEAEQNLKEARDERIRSLDLSLASQRLEVDLIGKTAGEAARLRMEFDLISQVREEAARNHVEADEAEIARIREKAAELEKVIDLQARLNLQNDLQFERRQMFRSPEDQEIASRMRSAGMADDLDSGTAAAIRFNLQLERMREAWEDVFDTARDGIDGVVDALFEGGSISDALKDAGRQLARTLFDQAITNPLKNWLTGSSLNTIADLGIFGNGASSGRGGGFGGVLGSLLGAQKAVASMQVQAASVFINGSPLGGVPGLPGTGNLSKLLGGSNDNDPAGAINRTGGLIDLAGRAANSNNASSVQSQVWNFFAGKGLAPHQIAGIMGNVGAESAFNPLAIGDGGSAFGLFQHNDRAANLFSFLGGRGNLGNVQGQLDFAWKELQGSEGRALQALLGSKDVRGATTAFAGFERPSGFSWANPEASHNFVGRLRGAEEALAKFGDVAGNATGMIGDIAGISRTAIQGLEQFGIGAGNLGSMLQSLMNTGGGFGGNWFSNLAGMFGGPGGALNHMMGISPMATAHILKGGVGLFAEGTESAPPGWAWVGEKGPELMRLRGGETIRSNQRSMQMMQASNGGGGMSAGSIEAIVGAISKRLSLNVKNVNVLDPSVVGDYLRTDEGEQLVMNIQRRNQAA